VKEMKVFKELMLDYGIITLVMLVGWGGVFFALITMFQ
jgi:hypothetical protein